MIVLFFMELRIEIFNVLSVLTFIFHALHFYGINESLEVFYYKLGDKNSNLFTSGPEIKNGMRNIGFTAPYLYCFRITYT